MGGGSAMHTPMHTGNGVLTFRCDDQLGVVSTLADVIQEHRANMISLDLMIGTCGYSPGGSQPVASLRFVGSTQRSVYCCRASRVAF